ncbi:unnamed protein product [Candidula unifasciata]|uniref:N-acetyltransferase domain-containing protein n=1 Tax=Candidula unifasciata TaxID=100452 RepID=A0A8S3YLN1_9EUPU|nr:unnamed protein product [Candidula unifasciata]
MAAETPNVIIRPARPEDFNDLMGIGDVYYGRDYLKAHYHTYFDNPDIYPLVAELDGKAIGFYMSHIIDGGRTLIKRAARVHPNYRDKKIFHQLSDALDRHREQFLPHLEYEVFGATNKVDGSAGGFQKKGFTEIVRKRILNLLVPTDNLKGLDANPDEAARLTLMTYDDVKLLFANKDVVNRMVPNGVLYNWFLGYKIFEENIEHFVNDNAFVFASTSSATPAKESVDRPNHNFTADSIKLIDILSFARKHEGGGGLTYWIDLYTAEGYDDTLIKTHLLKHLEDYKRSTNKDGILIITLNPGLGEELVLACLKDYGIVDFVPNTETHTVFYERKLKV